MKTKTKQTLTTILATLFLLSTPNITNSSIPTNPPEPKEEIGQITARNYTEQRYKQNKCMNQNMYFHSKDNITLFYKNKEGALNIITAFYGCDVAIEEVKNNPENPNQDGNMYLITTKTKKTKQSFFDRINKKAPLAFSPDTQIYHTKADAQNSEEYKKTLENPNNLEVNIQGYNINTYQEVE